MKDNVTLQVKRSEPINDYQNFEVPYFDGMTMLVALRYVHENLDSTLAFRNNHCGRGVCTTCLMKVNGKNVRACCFQVENGDSYKVDPANNKVIRDLVVEF